MLHITQAALGEDEVTNEQVLQMLETRGTVVEYSIGGEVHPTPADPQRPRHKHAYVKYLLPINHRDRRYCTLFDMQSLCECCSRQLRWPRWRAAADHLFG